MAESEYLKNKAKQSYIARSWLNKTQDGVLMIKPLVSLLDFDITLVINQK